MALSEIRTFIKEYKDFASHTYYWLVVIGHVKHSDLPFGEKYPRLRAITEYGVKICDKFINEIQSPLAQKWDDFLDKYWNGSVKITIPYMRKRDWYDIDNRMFITMFSLLCDFIELELPTEARYLGNNYAAHCIRGHRYPAVGIEHLKKNHSYDDAGELEFLYLWWKQIRNPDVEPDYDVCSQAMINKISGGDETKTVMIRSDSWEFRNTVDDEMLARLLAVRHSLWT